jgi:hypothetical protein
VVGAQIGSSPATTSRATSATRSLGVFGTGLVIDTLHPLVPTAPQRFTALGHVYITALIVGQSVMTLGGAVEAEWGR